MSKFRAWKRSLFPKLGGLAFALVSAIGKTLKVQTVGWEKLSPDTKPYLFAGWHGRSFVATRFFRDRGFYAIISNSRDGEMQNKIFQKFGFKTIRGSTGREGVKAAIEAIRVLKEGGSLTMTPDGPRGPSGVVQPGIMMMAQKSGAEIIPTGVSAAKCWYAKSWDRYLVPKPFSKAVMIFAEPITVPKDATPEQVEELRIQLERAIDATQLEADRMMGQA
ncbi:MAG: lysophospholipid acyltransferase family protein [Armatimonadetes bacterium]|nr:lysophospholipid acyltransferase family protein [Armatimonadota bacterium]